MKNFIKILSLLSVLNFIPIISMEGDAESIEMLKVSSETPKLDLAGSLANEIWTNIILYFVLDAKDLDKSKNIYHALNNVINKIKKIRCVCKAFETINDALKKDYRSILRERFLEFRGKGLYPKDGSWDIDDSTDKDIAKFFLTTNKDHSRLLSWLSFHGHVNTLVLVLFYYESVNIADACAQSLLKTDSKNIIKLLLAYGANINVQDGFGDTMLHKSLFTQSIKNAKTEIEFLLSRGAKVNIKNKEGNIALYYAIRDFEINKRMLKVIKMLLKDVISVDITNNEGTTLQMIGLAKGIDLEKTRKDIYRAKIRKDDRNTEKAKKRCNLM